ncbi:serine/threonine-protein phosphatase 6 regulatory ankyrin repeat subunit B-like [Corticium candelabrum]|uniref:serine/threonine-protein phosphatase 6 regulatory ankyrin repeat subunit B-like n=1 Tax=Corticium candelabrum TaxID=121492 RepID=UPI002E25EFFD|nr:serine/threonine-protein phosphatase 6 regulatory ankyrin repeat subunit B-like [Corticium candelabrum]
MKRNVAQAARNKEWEEVRRLVEQGENVNTVDGGVRRTALHYGVIWENLENCSFLVTVTRCERQSDRQGWKSASSCRCSSVQLLVDCGADVNALTKSRQTPLHTAAGGYRECPELCSILLEHKSKIDAVDEDGNQPLHLACQRMYFATVNLLLSYGADVTALDKQKRRPLHLASKSILKTSLYMDDLGLIVVDHDHDGSRALSYAVHKAAEGGDIQTVQLLVDCGENVNASNKLGQTPLYKAAGGYRECPELCSILLEHKAKIAVVDKDGNHPLHLACKRGHTRTSRLLVSNRADINAVNKTEQTPLHTAAGGEKDYPEMCTSLLEHKATIDAVDKDGNQPLHLSCKQRHFATANLFLSYGADVTSLNKQKRKPLHLASDSILKSAKVRDGSHALHIAVKDGDIQTVQLLVDCGADVNALTKSRQKPLHTAAGGYRECPEFG